MKRQILIRIRCTRRLCAKRSWCLSRTSPTIPISDCCSDVLPAKYSFERLLDGCTGDDVRTRTDRNGLCTRRILMMEFVKRDLMEGKVQVPKAVSVVMGMGKFLMGSRLGKAI